MPDPVVPIGLTLLVESKRYPIGVQTSRREKKMLTEIEGATLNAPTTTTIIIPCPRGK